MNYEEKYKQALERAKKLHSESIIAKLRGDKEKIEEIFPELKESEDEKIRKAIIEFFETQDENTTYSFVKRNDIISWLEKQGGITKLSEEEQNRFAKGVLSSCALSFINYLDAHKYESKMCVSNGECEDIENAFHNAMWDRLHRYYCKYIEKQGEKSWSEEDEHRLKDAIYFLETAKGHYASTVELDACIAWLKSLKPQSHWKPSEEQMEALNTAVAVFRGLQGTYPIKDIESLYNELKTLV